ncbi:ankyrin repeat protein, putative [Trichomonas vaginalis G3]|uniref:Ankyrin repeat protein, putative n=1 Tax=Trichomonas vaginalis (strain ATCC PRA-98 / G3) TaxID=412133 RepID=A2DDC5_TRIV3|nr:ankyrin repeat protein, putative [Trichomonas vaginalis G3]|eukprot:XP_001582590.1 ankyrin repeat protein [Trichomonas vaginalis G3]
MSNQTILPTKYDELISIYKYHINIYNALYRLKTGNNEELNSIYKLIKIELIETRKYPPPKIIKDILDIIPYKNRYAKFYLELAKIISTDYDVTKVNSISLISNFLFYNEYRINLDKTQDFVNMRLINLDIHKEDPIFRAIMNNDFNEFISITGSEHFDDLQKLESDLYPGDFKEYSLLELCCYHGAVDCFKILRTKFESKITPLCLILSFLGGNSEIMSECLKDQKPDKECMKYAIISHNIDFVTFLMNEYHVEINLIECGLYNNLDSFLVYFDQTNDINSVFVRSAMFEIPSLCRYFLSLGSDINTKDKNGVLALNVAAGCTCNEMVELLISLGANINGKDKNGRTALYIAIFENNKEIVETFLSHGANINEKDEQGKTYLHTAAIKGSKKAAELLLSHGANINEKDKYGSSALFYAILNNKKEVAELLLSHGANINEKDKYGSSALFYAILNNKKEVAELLLSHGANINGKNKYGMSCLGHAIFENKKEIVEFLILHGADINEKFSIGLTALNFAANNNCKDVVELLLSYGIDINEKDDHGKTALHYAAGHKNSNETNEPLLLHGANINEKDEFGQTALHCASEANNLGIVRFSSFTWCKYK